MSQESGLLKVLEKVFEIYGVAVVAAELTREDGWVATGASSETVA